MKINVLLLTVCCLLGIPAAAQHPTLHKPTTKGLTSFAIVVDNTTFAKITPQVYAYRDAVEQDGLPTYILRGDWEHPDQVRTALKKLAKKAPSLEGIVLVGDIPVVMVRNAQHMTTAFKMNEETFPKNESSVASDRFYDDLHLEFEYLDRDTVDTDFFYYRLKNTSPQDLNPTFYSGRIKVPSSMAGDKYQLLAQFLEKVVAAKQVPDVLDNIVTYAGNAYNSDCLMAWQDENVLLAENFPTVPPDSRHLKRLNFRMEDFMKYRLFDQLERPDVDAFFFNEHGSIDKQHISGSPLPKTAQDYLERYKWEYGWVYAYLDEASRERDVKEVVQELKQEYHLTDAFFEDYFDPDARARQEEKEQEVADQGIISLPEIDSLCPQPRYIAFNACYNGSFHRPGNVGGSYLFGPGRTVAVQGNTVNVLQDRRTYAYVGLLSLGCRVGTYNRLVATLEGHILGDPTFHFAVADAQARTLGQDVVARAGDVSFWRQALQSPYAAVQCVALRQLAALDALPSQTLLDTLSTGRWATVRTECLYLLSRRDPDVVVQAITRALHDRYELTRRLAATLAGRCGDPRLAPVMMDVYVNHPEEQRVSYALSSSFYTLPADDLRQVAQETVRTSSFLHPQEVLEATLEEVERGQQMKERAMASILSSEASTAERIMSARMLRNYNYHEYIPQCLALVADNTQDTSLRVVMTEALGWFVYSYRLDYLKEQCRALLADKSFPEPVREALRQIVIIL